MTYFYIVKYALTRGIVPVRGKVSEADPNMLEAEWQGGLNGKALFWRKKGITVDEWAHTEKEAFEIANRMRKRQIERLRKQASKLENMTLSLLNYEPVRR